MTNYSTITINDLNRVVIGYDECPECPAEWYGARVLDLRDGEAIAGDCDDLEELREIARRYTPYDEAGDPWQVEQLRVHCARRGEAVRVVYEDCGRGVYLVAGLDEYVDAAARAVDAWINGEVYRYALERLERAITASGDVVETWRECDWTGGRYDEGGGYARGAGGRVGDGKRLRLRAAALRARDEPRRAAMRPRGDPVRRSRGPRALRRQRARRGGRAARGIRASKRNRVEIGDMKMKKIINGKKYNTDTAKKIAEYSTPDKSSFYYTEEALYMKRTGEYFIHGYSHAAGPYAKNDGFGWYASSDIRPISEDRAREWAEKCLTCDEYEAIFGEVVE